MIKSTPGQKKLSVHEEERTWKVAMNDRQQFNSSKRGIGELLPKDSRRRTGYY